jgi:hypothetical protein
MRGRGGLGPSSVRIRSLALQAACKSKPLVPASYLHLASSLGPPNNRVRAPLESAPIPPCRILSLMSPRDRHPRALELGSASIPRASGTPCPRCWAGRARRRGREGGQGGAARREWRGGEAREGCGPGPPHPHPHLPIARGPGPIYIYTPTHRPLTSPHYTPLTIPHSPPEPFSKLPPLLARLAPLRPSDGFPEPL